ncbi:MAG: type VI secretion lipoprotein TssJ [Deltaproteobacteria bacterium]|nr:type VI secretion lipoprotein TssJ [Deltaproteobacteria bacterium]
MASRLFFMVFLSWSALALEACSHPSEALSPEPGPPVKSLDLLQFLYAPKAIKIGLVASRDLNLTDGVPAALSLCLYQLSDLKWFQGNLSSPKGLSELLSCPGVTAGETVPPGVVGAQRLLIQPGETQDLSLDRLAGARQVGVVGGFSSLTAPGVAGFLLIPVHENKKWIFANTYEIQDLNAWLLLRSQSLAFFPKREQDLKVQAEKYADKDPKGEPAPVVCPPSVCPAAVPAAPAKTVVPTMTAPPSSGSSLTPTSGAMKPGVASPPSLGSTLTPTSGAVEPGVVPPPPLGSTLTPNSGESESGVASTPAADAPPNSAGHLAPDSGSRATNEPVKSTRSLQTSSLTRTQSSGRNKVLGVFSALYGEAA